MFEHTLIVANQNVQRVNAWNHRSIRGRNGKSAHRHRD